MVCLLESMSSHPQIISIYVPYFQFLLHVCFDYYEFVSAIAHDFCT